MPADISYILNEFVDDLVLIAGLVLAIYYMEKRDSKRETIMNDRNERLTIAIIKEIDVLSSIKIEQTKLLLQELKAIENKVDKNIEKKDEIMCMIDHESNDRDKE